MTHARLHTATLPQPAPSAQPVLVVDDDPTAAAATEAVLAAGGFRVALEPRGDAALRLVRTMYLRLVVAELYVPCAEGRCVATVLGRQRADYPRLRLIVYTRHTLSAGDVAWAFAAGAEAVLRQPMGQAALVREVRRLDESALRSGRGVILRS